MGNDLLTGFLAGQSDSGNNGGNSGGFFGNEGLWAVIILAIIFGWGRNGSGFGPGSGDNSSGGGNNVTYVPYPAMGFGGGCSCSGGSIGAEVQRGFDNQAVISKLDGITQGICDSTYALSGTMTTGFSNAELSRCQQQAALMQQLSAMQMQDQNCCCETREAIQGVRYDLATQGCDIRHAVEDAARDIIDNQNANYRGLMDFMVQDKLAAKDARIAALENEVSQANQNAVIGARIDAAVAEILRRNGGCNSGCGSCC